jgi:hypothetical protein
VVAPDIGPVLAGEDQAVHHPPQTLNTVHLRSLTPPILGALLAIAGTGCNRAPQQPAPISAASPTPQPSTPTAHVPSETEAFFVDWLERHGEKHVLTDSGGVGLAGNATRLRASTYGVDRSHANGISVELEFRVALPGGGEIVEYLAGLGADESKARKDCLGNFVLTTFHPIYKAFMNAEDPHQRVDTFPVDGKDRQLLRGNLIWRGTSSPEQAEIDAIADRLRDLMFQQHFATGPHWVKVVYSQAKGKPMTVEVTRDNTVDDALTAAVTQLPWPAREEFYMAKQFIVVE